MFHDSPTYLVDGIFIVRFYAGLICLRWRSAQRTECLKQYRAGRTRDGTDDAGPGCNTGRGSYSCDSRH
ncbi:MAG: hypothetical protein NVS4B8_11590 [Herpetosiphon sp.]